MRSFSVIFFSLLFCFSFVAHAQSGLNQAEDFLVKDVNGNSHTLFSYLEEGKIVVLPFFTTTCGSCNIYTPEIVESFHDFGCNTGDVFYLGINWGANNIGVIDFMAVHAVGYPCASGTEGLGNETHFQYEIASNITALVILPDGTIAGQFFGPNSYPTRDSLNNLLLSLGAEMQNCGVDLEESKESNLSLYPNPVTDQLFINLSSISAGIYQLEILNLQGQNIQTTDIRVAGNKCIKINTQALPSGVYLLRLKQEDGVLFNQKLIKN
jgi:hypothetical protein